MRNLIMNFLDIMRSKLPVGTVLFTPSGDSRFVVNEITDEVVKLSVGETPTSFKIPIRCFEEVVEKLPTEGSALIGAVRGKAFPGTIDYIVQRYTKATAASYVAPILEHIGLAEIIYDKAHRIRRKKD